MVFYCSYELVVANLFIILIENKCCHAIKYDEVQKFFRILQDEAESKGIILRGKDDECDYEYEEYFWRLKDEIICGSAAMPSLLIYNFRIHHNKNLVDIFKSENVELKTLKMMGCEKAEEKHVIDVQDDIDFVNEQIDYRSSLRQFEYCIEYQKRLEKLEYIKERFPEMSPRSSDKNDICRTNKKEGVQA